MIKKFLKKALLVGIVIVHSPVKSQAKYDVYDNIAKEVFQNNPPGGVVLIAEKGKITYEKAFGLAQIELNVPMKTDMVFEIGSITKQFTAVALLQLVEQHKIQLNDPIIKYFPDFPNHCKDITIHHLLNHTSGLNNFTSEDSWSDVWRLDLPLSKTIDLFINKPLAFQPGEKFSYCNSGYIILGALIEKISGESYANYLQKNIFDPLEMKDTYFGSRSKLIKNRAHGYQKNKEYINAEYVTFSQTHAAGALMSTTHDLLKWYTALYNHKVITPKSLALATTNYKTNTGEPTYYGYGWFINEINGLQTVEHGGGIFGFLTYAMYLPTEGILIIVLTNYDLYNPEALTVKLAALATNQYQKAIQPIKLSPKKGRSWVGNYEFEDGITRSILLENNILYSQIPGRDKIALIPVSDNEFYFEGIAEAKIEFSTEKTMVKALLKNRMVTKTGWKKTKKDQTKTITLNEEQLQRLVGEYKIPPSLTFTLTAINKSLIVNFPGQSALELWASDETHFFNKTVGVEFIFDKNENNNVTAVTIVQNGQKIIAKKSIL
ncbi:serine hydrolase domain-containing protein [Flavobacterium sedimenticola]|uniref:Serine hydrolase domain-containing protein n=1 Tax=Flavobacterium sedimenticola TaxID=3043286 RepID=A0ABT6XSU2_9FLAO|nr:serine hydrolase domain-containing protein [Flavobacterium sedimenticola]MDI9258176.1 serine hydrolase domain-containing protein [Flavobacterium sedimenticola]